MSICAGIVLCNPEIDRLRQNIDAILPQVELLILVDNGSESIDSLKKTFTDIKIVRIENAENYGIAKALNQMVNYASEQNYRWILTLDQDSVCDNDLVEQLYKVANENQNVAMVTPRVIDRNLTHESVGGTPNVEEVDRCITSGCLTNIQAVINSGGFDERLFIDEVDHDMCFRLRHNGYMILRANTTKLLQEYGLQTIERKLFGKKVNYRNYSPMRVYYQTRNMLYMLRKYGTEYKPNVPYSYLRMFMTFTIKFIFEPNRIPRLKQFVRGYKDGLKMEL